MRVIFDVPGQHSESLNFSLEDDEVRFVQNAVVQLNTAEPNIINLLSSIILNS